MCDDLQGFRTFFIAYIFIACVLVNHAYVFVVKNFVEGSFPTKITHYIRYGCMVVHECTCQFVTLECMLLDNN